MSFVRLAGCNGPALGLDCVGWCDTPDSWDENAGDELDVEEVLDRVRLPRLCVTGGEPLLQLESVAALVAEAHTRGIRTHLETNGTVDPLVARPVAGRGGATRLGGDVGMGPGADEAIEFDWVVVSPKPPRYFVSPAWDERIDELKLVVDDQLDVATAERLAVDYPGAFVSIQPEFGDRSDGSGREWNRAGSASVRRAIALVLAHPDWRLSLQTHKLLGIR
jgi:organic radical activating enzyme